MPKWTFEYYNGSSWTEFTAKLNQTNELLNGHEEFLLNLENVGDEGEANRLFVSVDQVVRLNYNSNVLFTGRLVPLKYKATKIECVVYNIVYESMKPKTITADYSNGEAADVILAAICTAAGVTAGTCPSTEIAVRFDEASCYDAALFLCDCLNLDHWTSDGTTFNIGTRGTLKTVTHVKIKDRDCDRAKVRDKVRVKGVDSAGLAIVGEAGTGDNVAVYREKKASDVATLNTLAAKYLAELNTDAKGTPVEVPIDEGYSLAPGDTIELTNARYNVDGTLKFYRVIKKPTKVEGQLEKAKASLEQMLLDVRKYNDLGIYPNQPSQITPWTLNTSQGLFGLYHLGEGSGTTAKDSNPTTDTAHDGTITNGDWVDGVIAGTKVLNFDADGYIHLGSDFNPAGADHFAVGCWFSPEESFSDGNYLILKEDQFYLQHYGTDNRVRFGVKIGSTWHTVTSDANVSELWSRNFLIGVYDGAQLKLYLNNVLVASDTCTGNVDACANDTFIGSTYHGVVNEVMLWLRALSGQEVQELYFFPLHRIVRRGGGSPAVSGWSVAVSNDTGGTVDPIGIVHVDSGQSLQVTATVNSAYDFLGWEFDGESVGTDNPYTVAAQADGSSHTLIARFRLKAIQAPNRSGIMVINADQGFESIHAQVIADCSNTPLKQVNAQVTATLITDPTQWHLKVVRVPDLGAVSPEGDASAGGGVGITVTASTTQYAIYQSMIADGASVNANAATRVLLGTDDPYSFSAQPLGTTHMLQALFRAGWEFTLSRQGTGTLNLADGTYEVVSGNAAGSISRVTGTLLRWLLDGEQVSTSTSYNLPVQTDRTSHTLVAVFS